MLNFAHFGPMSQFPPSPYGCFGSSPLIGPYGWFGGNYGQLSENPAPSPDDKVKPNTPIQTLNGGLPFYGATGGYPGFAGLPPDLKLPPFLLWQMRKYSTIQLALSIINGPWLAGNEEIEIDPNVPEGMKAKVEEWKVEAEQYVDPIWQQCKPGAAEAVALGNFLWEIIYDRVDAVSGRITVPIRAKSHLATRVDTQLYWDQGGVFSGFRVNGQYRDSRYAFLAVNDPHIDSIYGYSRSENCVDSWWRAIQSNLNADKTEQKASGIQFGVGAPPGATFQEVDGKQTNVNDCAQKIIQAASVGNCFTFPLFMFGQGALERNPELAKVSPFKFERFDWGDVGPNLLASIARLTRTDIEIIRAYRRPEREAMEAQHGSKADSGNAGGIGTTDSEAVHQQFLKQFSAQVLDRFCVTNYPGYQSGWLRYKATPLSDPQQEFLQKVAVALATDQSTGPELTKNFDLRGLAQRVEMPVLSEEDVKANEVIAQKKAADAQQQAIDLAKASAKPIPANGKPATNGSPVQNVKPRIAASADARPHLSRLLGDMLNEPRMTYLGDEYDASDISEDLSCDTVTHVDRIADMETTLALGADESGHWVTIEGEHVYINDAGKIVKGPANLEGKSVDELPPRSTPDTHHHDQKNPEVSPDEHKRKWIAAYRKNAELDRKEQEKREAKKKPVGRKHDGKSRSDRPNPKMRPPRPDEVRSRKISSVIGDFAKSKGLQSWQLEMSQEQKENLLYEHRDQLRFISASADARPHLGDEYEPDESPIALAADEGDGHWVTIDGTHVYLGKGGQIEKGPKALVGKTPSDIGGDLHHHHEHTDPATPPTEVPHTHPGKSVMYHGSSAKFSTFTHDHVSGENKYGPASYFTPDPDEAKQWNADHIYTAEVTHDSPFRIDRDIQPEHGERINAAAAKLGKQGLDKGFEKNSQAYSSYQNLARNNGDSKATANAILREAGFDSIVDKHELASLEPGKAKVLSRESKDTKLSEDFTGKAVTHADIKGDMESSQRNPLAVQRDALEKSLKDARDKLQSFPRLGNGLAPDAVRVTSEYQQAKRNSDAAFAELRNFNGKNSKELAKISREERDAKRSKQSSK